MLIFATRKLSFLKYICIDDYLNHKEPFFFNKKNLLKDKLMTIKLQFIVVTKLFGVLPRNVIPQDFVKTRPTLFQWENENTSVLVEQMTIIFRHLWICYQKWHIVIKHEALRTWLHTKLRQIFSKYFFFPYSIMKQNELTSNIRNSTYPMFRVQTKRHSIFVTFINPFVPNTPLL